MYKSDTFAIMNPIWAPVVKSSAAAISLEPRVFGDMLESSPQ